MKTNLIKYVVLIFTLVINSCGGGTGRDEPLSPSSSDNSVKATTLLTPIANELCISLPINFTWQAVPNATKYVLTLSKIENGQEILISNKESTTTSITVSDLEKGKLYKWKIETVGSKNSAVSTVQQFQTEASAATNHAPFAPEAISPIDGSNYSITGNTAFKWKGADPDGDVLKFDVYLGTDKTNLQISKSSLTTDSFNFTNLSVGKKYYWRIDAVDTKGNKTIGQVWSFNVVN